MTVQTSADGEFYQPGDRVRVVDGSFHEVDGTVQKVDVERGMVRITISYFGRETPVELDFLQIEKT